jgi:hypothetical protein
MGQAFSGPTAFEWLHLTPEATAVLQADPFLFVTLVIVLFGCTAIIMLAWYIHFVTNKVRELAEYLSLRGYLLRYRPTKNP